MVQPGLVLVMKEGGLSQLSTVKDGVQCCRKGPRYGQRQTDRKIRFWWEKVRAVLGRPELGSPTQQLDLL